jgi:hypothetical protein
VKGAGTDTLPGIEDPPDEDTVRELVTVYKRSEAIVRSWSRAKAQAVLHGLRREEAIVANKAVVQAGADEAGLTRPRPVTDMERLDAAEFLEQALARGPFETALALSFAVMAMQDAEQKKLAGWLVKRFRGEG